MPETQPTPPPSAWVCRFAPLVAAGGTVLDIACGSGRHTALFAERGYRITAVDRDVSRIAQRAGVEIVEADLEGDAPWPFPGRPFDGIVATNYLHRPLMPRLIDSLAPGGALIYETFAAGNERLGRPRNPDFLLRDGELLDMIAGKLSVVAYEAGMVDRPASAVIQRIAAIAPGRQPAENPPVIPPPA